MPAFNLSGSLDSSEIFVPMKNVQNSLVTKQTPKPPKDTICSKQLGDERLFVLDQASVDQGNQHLAEMIAAERNLHAKKEAFAVFNVDYIIRLFAQWRQNMPRVKPFYAVKCNNDPVLVATLAKLGAGFDCASREEIDLIMDNGFGQPKDIIYANTCKTPEFIRHAQSRGINRYTFDCAEELAKVQREHKDAQLVLRIDVTDPSAKRPLDIKFGCDPVTDAPRLLRVAKRMGMQVIGISFHVGSGCQNPLVYRQAILLARKLFTIGEELGHRMHVVDLGGGFPGCEDEREFFEQVSSVVSAALNEFFPAEDCPLSPQRKISADSGLDMGTESDAEDELIEDAPVPIPGLEIIAEPGRYFASSPTAVCANVIGATRVNAQKLTKRSEDGQTDAYMYYLDDGVYGSFSCLSSRLFTKVPDGKPLFGRHTEEKHLSVVWGPTCDSRDQVEQLGLKTKLEPGDWLFYSDMGAYTRVTATQFNGFTRPKDTYYVVGEFAWKALETMGGNVEN